ncbi:hypothetical protein [Corynebacterium sp. H113]|uniref:hypothetical protein n=1 Tax=Corynebacterium sp. H113 TaxID=3133419 RepID=UPI0030ABA89F
MNRDIATSQVCRILAGVGAMTLVPYKIDARARIEVLAHGVNSQGQLVFTCLESDVVGFGDMPARMDVEKKAPEFSADIVASSVHALVEIRWGESDGRVRVGVIHLDRLFFHGVAGPVSFNFRELLPEAQQLCEVDGDEIAACEAVVLRGAVTLSHLVAVASAGMLNAYAVSARGNVLHTKHDEGIYVVDVNKDGVTLMEVAGFVVTTVEIPFVRTSPTFESLEKELAALSVEASARHVSMRI